MGTKDILRIWNSSVMNNGRLSDGETDADSASAIPGILHVMDLPDSAGLPQGRKLLFAAARNLGDGAAEYRGAWERNSSESDRPWFLPGQAFTAELLLEWQSRF